MISPSNTFTGLTRPYRGMAPGELERLYPPGSATTSGSLRPTTCCSVALVEAAQGAAAGACSCCGIGDDEDMAAFADDMRAAARTLGLEVVGAAGWDPGAASFDGPGRRVAAARPDAVLMAGAAPPHVGPAAGPAASLGRGPR